MNWSCWDRASTAATLSSWVGTPGAMVALSTRKPPGCDFLPRRKDHIVMVNGLSMENVSSSFAIQTLKTCGKIVNIVSGT